MKQNTETGVLLFLCLKYLCERLFNALWQFNTNFKALSACFDEIIIKNGLQANKYLSQITTCL